MSAGATGFGSVATIAKPMGEMQKRPEVKGLQPAEKVMKGSAKKKGPYQNSIVEGKKKDFLGKLQKNVDKANKAKKDTEEKVKQHQADQDKKKVEEAKLDEDDLIVIPGRGMKRKTGFVKNGESRVDHEVAMARSDLVACYKNAKAIFELLKSRTEEEGLEGWVQEKLIKASDYLNAVKEYYDEQMMREMTGGVIAGGGVGEGVAESSEKVEMQEDEYDKMLRDLIKARPDLLKKYSKDTQRTKDIESGKELNKLVKKNPGVVKTYSDAVKRDKKLGISEEGVAEGQLELNTPDPVVVIADPKTGKILDQMNLSIASQKYKLGPPDNIKKQLAHQSFTTIGNYRIQAPMAGQPQDKTTMENFHKKDLDNESFHIEHPEFGDVEVTYEIEEYDPNKLSVSLTGVFDNDGNKLSLGDFDYTELIDLAVDDVQEKSKKVDKDYDFDNMLESKLDEKFASQQQAKLMYAVAGDKDVAKKTGVSQKVAKEFIKKSKGQKVSKLPTKVSKKD